MGDSPPLSPDSMTEEQFLQFISRAPAAYQAAASQYWVARGTGQTPPGWTPAGPTPFGTTPAGGTPIGATPADPTPLGTTPAGGTPFGGTPGFMSPPQPSSQPSPSGSSSRRVRQRRTPQHDTGAGPSRSSGSGSRSRSGGGGSRGGSTGGGGGSGGGGGCCGGGSTDAVSPVASPRPSASDAGTPHSTPRTPWGAHDYDDSKLYRIRDGAPVMDAAGKAMRQRIRQLCTVQFGHTIMVKWSAQDKDRKNYITEAIYREYRSAPGHLVVS